MIFLNFSVTLNNDSYLSVKLLPVTISIKILSFCPLADARKMNELLIFLEGNTSIASALTSRYEARSWFSIENEILAILYGESQRNHQSATIE